MAILTTTKLGDKNSQPETQINWAGEPFKPSLGEAYGGKIEHMSNREKLVIARRVLAEKVKNALPLTEEQRQTFRERMAHARKFRKRKALPSDTTTL